MKRLLVGLGLVFLIAVTLVGLRKLRPENHKRFDSAATMIAETSAKYEFWTMQLSGTAKNPRCPGQFKEDLSIDVLYPGGLSKVLRADPTGQIISGKAVIAGYESVQSAFRDGARRLIPDEMADIMASIESTWSIKDGVRILRSRVTSNSSLVKSACRIRGIDDVVAIPTITLIANRFENNEVSGRWVGGKEGEPAVTEGRFVMRWISGGESKIPLPGPTEVRAIAGSKAITLNWKAWPGASTYRVFYVKGSALKPESAPVFVETGQTTKIFTGLEDGIVYTFQVAPMVDGQEASRSLAISAVPDAPIVSNKVASGLNHACAIVKDGQVLCWGSNGHGQVGAGQTSTWSVPVKVRGLNSVKSISAGEEFSCALLSDGTVKCWGNGEDGRLGNGLTTDSIVPVLVKDLAGVKEISSRNHLTCALIEDGGVKCWGNGVAERFSPHKEHFVSLSVGEGFGCGLGLDRSLKCWADNSEPRAVSNLDGVLSFSLGKSNGCAIDRRGQVRCFERDLKAHVIPISLPSVDVAVGNGFACASLRDKTVACWGDNHLGQLGMNSRIPYDSPVVLLSIQRSEDAGTMAAGGDFICAPNILGFISCWGGNGFGQTGSGFGPFSLVPQFVVGRISEF